MAIVATQDGNIWEVSYHPQKGKGQTIIAHFDGIVSIAGFYTRDDNFRIVLVATKDGDVHEVFYHPQKGKGQSVIAHHDGIVNMAATFGSCSNWDDRQAIMVVGDGKVYQLRYHPMRGKSESLVDQNNDVLSVAANRAGFFTVSRNGRLQSINSCNNDRNEVANLQGIHQVAVDYRDADNLVYTTTDGSLHKVLYTSPPLPLPRYNEVLQKSTHNSYWLDVTEADSLASGTQERIIDQVLHEGVRAFEFDLHFEAGHAGEFTVYHTSAATTNSGCHYLTDCLDLIKRLDYLQPDHEVVTILIEFKETLAASRVFGQNGVIGPLKHDHAIEDLDRQLWERLGSRLYTPREFLSRCPAGLTMRQCAGLAGWPTLDELRGRYIVTLQGNWSDNYWDWHDYASSDIQARAAFPMRNIWASGPDDVEHVDPRVPDWLRAASDYEPWVELNGGSLMWNADHPYIFSQLQDQNFKRRLLAARDASIFWAVENESFANGDVPGQDKAGRPGFNPSGLLTFLYRDRHKGTAFGNGVVRIGDGGDGFRHPPARQLDTIQRATYQQYQTDFPWNTIFNETHSIAPSYPMPDRPFFERAGFLPNGTLKFHWDALREPGARLYLRQNAGRARVDATIDATVDTDWEVQPSTTTVTHDEKLPPAALPLSEGCLFARAPAGDEVQVCRKTLDSTRREVQISVNVWDAGSPREDTYTVPHQEPGHMDVGDLLRMQVLAGGRTVRLFTAGTMGPDERPRWNLLPIGDLHFGTSLTTQGLRAMGDVLFVAPRLNGQRLSRSSFTRLSSSELVHDLSWCVDGTCLQMRRPDHVRVRNDSSGALHVAVHEAYGRVYGQDRHLYTSDEYEALTSGLIRATSFEKFLLRREPAGNTAPVFRCADQRRDYHTHWLSLDLSCSQANGPTGESSGALGHIRTDVRARFDGLLPLKHFRKGTHNDGSDNTYDDYYAVGDSDEVWATQNGYQEMESLGWVHTPASVGRPPCQPKTQCRTGAICGWGDDGCGGRVSCGSCPAGQTCNQTANLCMGAGDPECLQRCDEHYQECLETVTSPAQRAACGNARQACINGCRLQR